LGHPLALGELDQLPRLAPQVKLGEPQREATDPLTRIARTLARRARRCGSRQLVEKSFELAGRALCDLEAVEQIPRRAHIARRLQFVRTGLCARLRGLVVRVDKFSERRLGSHAPDAALSIGLFRLSHRSVVE